MKLKTIIDEDFINYKKPSMMLATCQCDWKCLKDNNLDMSICQNSELAHQKTIEISNEKIIARYLNNPISQTLVIGGLEPFLQFKELLLLIHDFREKCEDEVVIYTGYYPSEIKKELKQLKEYSNIIVKFGRYDPTRLKIFDIVLGVWLASYNQFAIKIS